MPTLFKRALFWPGKKGLLISLHVTAVGERRRLPWTRHQGEHEVVAIFDRCQIAFCTGHNADIVASHGVGAAKIELLGRIQILVRNLSGKTEVERVGDIQLLQARHGIIELGVAASGARTNVINELAKRDC
jgi:hypothetical protein